MYFKECDHIIYINFIDIWFFVIVAVQLLSRVQHFVTPWTAAHQASLSLHHLLERAQTQVHWVSNALQPSHPLSSPSPPALNLSQHQGLFRRVGSSHYMAEVLELQLQHQSFQCYSGLISFRIDWFDLLAVQGTLKSLFQHSSKASILWCSAFLTVQLSHLCMTTGKTIPLTLWTFGGKVISLLFSMLSRFVIPFFQGPSVF